MFEAQRYEAAVKQITVAANLGHADAQISLARWYYNGDGVEQNLAEATKWLHKSADQGSVEAQFMLGNCYLNGDGVEQNGGEAVKWFNIKHRGLMTWLRT